MPDDDVRMRGFTERTDLESALELLRSCVEPLEAELEAAVLGGETRAADPGRLESVLARHGLELPLPSADVGPAFPPGGVRTYESD